MIWLIITILGVMIGVILAVAVIVGIGYVIIRNKVGKSNMNQLTNAIKQAKNLQEEEYTRVKTISGMTNILEKDIRRDVKDFNSTVLFSKAQSNLTKIFNSITNKSVKEIENDEDFALVLPSIKKTIEDSTDISYRNIEFHDFAIRRYNRGTGVATITVVTNVGYYYNNSADKENEKFKHLKKETRYTCDFVYIYDESKFDIRQKGFTISCPNCGAPVNKLDVKSCEYCSSAITPINLKLWKLSSYKEDYKLQL